MTPLFLKRGVIKMKITPNFKSEEFACKCGCGGNKILWKFVERLQVLRYKLKAPIIITSGYRCPTHSVRVGGSTNDAHTKGFAADIQVRGYNSEQIAKAAAELGFGGIGIIDNYTVHVDIRDENGTDGVSYPNSYWHADERTGKNLPY